MVACKFTWRLCVRVPSNLPTSRQLFRASGYCARVAAEKKSKALALFRFGSPSQ